MSRKVWCQDWSCPARVSCAHHFGRSAAYAGMKEGAKLADLDGDLYDRLGHHDHQCCAQYKFDRKKPWLMPKPGEITHYPHGHEIR